MRRADRLFQIVQQLRKGRLVTAAELARCLEVSERTVYRDMRDLASSGVPVEGEAGVGYLLRDGYDLPPLMFTRDEVEALVVGARLARAWVGGGLADAAARALEKVEAVVPEARRRELADSRVFVPDFSFPAALRERMDVLRCAINARRVVLFDYRREDGTHSARAAQPLGLFFWGRVWTLGAWCELREEFRSFRIDRMETLLALDRRFDEIPGRGLEDYLARWRDEACKGRWSESERP
ncbi:YafY family protein [Azospirillum sp. TSO35-2]|uniref:helix-turn-helix transcriptional regulator n=1 Tax=Azospirillum sp. TSO35-2 TaxID=716796 RepID=UPI000D613CD7|nr:YafY family protein [Azospirillum sp. TSO35-2]PWC34121.1 DeoR family transcriptional regulator [Azospirillum sp. TSO35-2]